MRVLGVLAEVDAQLAADVSAAIGVPVTRPSRRALPVYRGLHRGDSYAAALEPRGPLTDAPLATRNDAGSSRLTAAAPATVSA